MKTKLKFAGTAIISSILLMGVSLAIYFFLNNGFLGEVHSEIFGVGAALFVLGLIYKLFKVKLG